MKNKFRFATSFKLAMGSALLFAASGALAQNAVIGKQLYETPRNPAYLSCSEATQCHGTSIAQNKNKIRNGTDPNKIISGLNSVPLMNPIKGYLTLAQATDIAAYIANPAAATAPVISASGTSLTFGTTLVGANNATSSPTNITLTNTGSGNLTISAITKSGTNAAEFAASGSCVSATTVTVAPGANCTLAAAFTPAAAGTRTATLTVASNAATNPAITLSGTGSAVPVPAVTLSRSAVTFATQTISTTSAAQTVTLTNSGSAALAVTQVSTMPTPEFASTSNCVGTINPGASCTISTTFTPSAAGTRSGTLTVTSNAASSPTSVALSGTSVLTATPIATIQSNTVAFPMTNVGVMSSGLSTRLTNTGNAPLQITAVALGGANASEFSFGAANTCAVGTIAVGASCQLEVAFMPQSSGTKSAVVTLSHNATGGSTAVNVSGMAATTTSNGSSTGGSAGTSSALAPSNVGGAGSVSLEHLMALALTLLLVPTLRRRLARR